MKRNIILNSFIVLLIGAAGLNAQSSVDTVPAASAISLAPARFEAEMAPGSETTFVVNLNYRGGDGSNPTRVSVSLNDWKLNKAGEIEYARAGTDPRSASSWILFSPSDAVVTPGQTNAIRVTISVPPNAEPGDHVAALIVEPRPDNPRVSRNEKVMTVRYRMAAMIYVKVPGLIRLGSLQGLKAEKTPEGVAVIPTLKNEGNSLIRPVYSATLIDENGAVAAELPASEALPVLARSELSQRLLFEKDVRPGRYKIKYKVDFQDGSRVVEGVTALTVN